MGTSRSQAACHERINSEDKTDERKIQANAEKGSRAMAVTVHIHVVYPLTSLLSSIQSEFGILPGPGLDKSSVYLKRDKQRSSQVFSVVRLVHPESDWFSGAVR